jgi:AGCS family alanine or glycine:cation symporter
VNTLTERIQTLDGLVWQPFAMPLVLVVVGGLLTVATGLVQIRRFPAAVRFALSGIVDRKPAQDGTITPFQALSTALASTVGNGNIGGVATAILIGGPGAIFWMWVTAVFGMATKYSEAVLGVTYRVKKESGAFASGPMYYIMAGVRHAGLAKVLAIMFCVFGAATALLGTGNMAQSNTIVRTFVEAASGFGWVVSPWVPGLLITVAVGAVLLGGIRRIASVAEKLVPTMLVIYLGMSLTYLLMNITALPGVFATIFEYAFQPHAAAGGFLGVTVRQAIAAGISRGVLSNEAGLGSAPIAHGIAQVKHPSDQGLVGVFEVFIDTIVVCSMTAFAVLSSGMWQDAAYQNASGDLTAAAFSISIPFAPVVIAISSFLFGFSTIIGWYYYGETCWGYMFGQKGIFPYRIIYVALLLIGGLVTVETVWNIGTLLNGFMAFPNLIGMLFLGGVVAKKTNEYYAGKT